ncbi:MAG: ABC transporter permease [Saprospiraceae bacterium]|nr:ABC transporter permease [Saprospiraceae bacterium]
MLNSILRPFVSYLPQNNRFQRIWKLAQVDYKKRFYNSNWGVIWALFNPLARLLIYFIVFQYLIPQSIDNYALYLFSGLLIWMFFTESTKRAFRVLITKKYLISSIRFNWIDLYLASTLSVFWGFLFNFLAYFLLSIVLQVDITLNYLYFPIYLFNIIILCLGFSILLATIYIYFVDIIHIWDLVLLTGFWTAPILFRGEVISEKFGYLDYIHPFTGIINNVRNSILFDTAPNWFFFFYNLLYGFVVLILAVFLFKKFSKSFLERI